MPIILAGDATRYRDSNTPMANIRLDDLGQYYPDIDVQILIPRQSQSKKHHVHWLQGLR